MKRLNRLISLLLAAALLLPMMAVIPAEAEEEIVMNEKAYRIWFDEEAPQTMLGFEEWSLPIGNGYMGLNVFGGVETELISVTENSLFNPYVDGSSTTPGGEERCKSATGGLNLLAKTYIDFGHSNVSNYQRDLDLGDAVASVSYDAGGVHYTREYFSSYPDKVSVMRLTASESGALTFTLRPIAPYVHDYLNTPGDGMGKTGKTVAQGDTVIVSGMMDWYDINYEGMYKVIPQGGTMVAANDENGENGTITVTGADSAVILLAVGTNYHMVPESFVSGDSGVKMDANEYPHEKVLGYMNAAAEKSYDQLLQAHQKDHKEFFDRASLDLGGVCSDTLTTDQLLANYKNGDCDPYLEELLFQYGRYLLIASSREGCLPANLQGVWNFGDTAAWSGGYWHNINVQMNYWPAFNTNLSELFQSYVDFNETFRSTTEKNADTYLKNIGSETMATAGTGQNGWAVGTNVNPYRAGAPGTTGHSGPGTGAFTSLLFWDYYDFTRDETILEEHTYPAVEGMANFLSKTLKEYDGKWLVANSASPENANKYRTVGTAFDQQMVYENHLVTLKSAEILGYTAVDHPLLATLEEQIDHLDPVNVGFSGQVKEYREENYYSDIGDPLHRHISQLVGLYPGTAINGTTEAWLDAARTTLNLRGDGTTGWSICHRLLAWARLMDGERSYKLIQKLMTTRTNSNLWTTHPPFQIDSNFGYTAGVAEMLVQGHAGYIEFLPALPSAWATGSFRGLTTRGAFEVDAAWENGQATKFVIKSNAGESCAVKYQNIATAKVVDSKGNPVSFTTEGTDLIRFATTEGETYTITGISAAVKVAAPTALTVTASGSTMNLSWNASGDAVSYNVYRAVNDDANYEQVATGVTGTAYTYTASDVTGADRVTMRVTAVGESGRESVGALAYSLPVTVPESVSGQFYGKDLQLEITGGAGSSYKVYADGSLVLETPYNVAVIENADSAKTYSVSTVSEGRESAAITATIFSGDNILLGKPLTHSDNVKILSNGKYPLSYAVDGVIETNTSSIKRWAVTELQAPYTVTADLQGTYKLGTFTFWEWLPNEKTTRSDNTKLEVLTPEGQWVTIKSGFALNPGAATEVDMGGVVATQIRMTFENTKAAKSCSITEITCSAVPVDAVDKTELGKLLQNYDSTAAGVKLAYITAKTPAESVLQDTQATQAEVDRAVWDVNNALNAANIFKKQTVTTDVPAYNNNTSKYGPALMVDENYSTRYAANDTGPSVTATVTLDGEYHIEAIFVQEYLNKNTLTRGKDVTIEIYDGTSWVTVVDGESLTSTPDTAGTYPATTAFVLAESVKGSQVRLSFVNNENKRITIYELQAYGQKVSTSGVSLSASVLTATSGKAVNLTATGTVSSWSSSNSAVLAVDGSGNITALAAGTATVTVTGTDGSTATCFVTVNNDREPLIEAIAAAKAALTGVSGIDKTPEQVISGKKFVPTATLEQLQNKLKEAEEALPGANSAQAVQTHTQALNTAISRFNEALQTGTMADNHNHDGVQWTAWGDDAAEQTTLPAASGNYYLVDNISLSTEQKVSAGNTVQLCLNGYNVTCADNNVYSVFGALSIYDCAEEAGTVSGGDTTNGGTFYVAANGALKLYGGKMTASSTAENGGVLYIADSGTAQIYDGLITGGNTTGYGGNIVNYGTLEIHGGTVENGSAANGGNICNRGTMTMDGGLVHAPAKSFNLLITSGTTATISGGTLQGNTTYNIRIWDSGNLTVSGGEIRSGSFTGQGSGIYADKGGAVTITGGTVSDVAINMVAETEGATNNAKRAASLTLRDATVEKLTLIDKNNTYDPQVTIGGKAVIGNVVSTDVKPTFEPLTEGAYVTYTGAVKGAEFGIGRSTKYIYGNNGLVAALEGTTLKWAEPKVVTVTQGQEIYRTSVQSAVDSESGYVKLLSDMTEDVTVSGNVYLDLNGKVLTGDVTGTGTLYGMDSATDKYTTDTMGRIEGTVSCAVAGNFKTDITGNIRRYMAISDDTGYTFHRFYMGITHINLKPGVTGVGYKAVFYGDEQVRDQVTGYGYTLWIGENGKKLSAGKDGAFISGKTVTARLQNFDVAAYGEAPIYGQVYLTLKDGATIESATYSFTLRNLVEQVAANAGSYGESQLSALRDMLMRFEETTSKWNIDGIM